VTDDKFYNIFMTVMVICVCNNVSVYFISNIRDKYILITVK